MPKKLPNNLAAKNRIFQKYKERAKKSEIIFRLSKKNFINITQENCYYCGIAPSNVLEHRDYYHCKGGKRTYKYGTPFYYNGIDRKDNNKGYILSNIVACCAICNRAKYKLSIPQFKTWLKRIKEYNG